MTSTDPLFGSYFTHTNPASPTLDDHHVVILSQHLLTNDQRNVLSFSLNFCPTPNTVDAGELRTDLDQQKKKITMLLYFSHIVNLKHHLAITQRDHPV